MTVKNNFKNTKDMTETLGCKIFDTHLHIGNCEYPTKLMHGDEIANMLERFNYGHAVVSSGHAILDDIVEGNGIMLEELEPLPHLFFYVTYNPNQPELSIQEVEKYKKHKQFAGLKFHPTCSGREINFPGSKKVLDYYREGVVLSHTYSKPSIHAMCEAAQNYPNINFILGHMGGNLWKETVDICKEFQNLYFEINCSFPDYDKIQYAVDEAGEDRVVFGSDAPLIAVSFNTGMVASAHVDNSVKKKILWDNPKRLFQRLFDNA